MAVAPLDKHGKPDYSQITIAFAGTGDAKKGADNYVPGIRKDRFDIQEDIQGIGKGQRDKLNIKDAQGEPTTVKSQFKSALKFAKKIKEDHPNAKINVTGHSLGGATALLVASNLHVPAKVFSAPDPWKAMNNEERLWSVTHPEMLLNYRHEGDLLSDTDSRALGINGATKKTMVDDPTAEFTAKIKQARKIKEDYVTLGKNVKAAVNKVVADDQELAQEFS